MKILYCDNVIDPKIVDEDYQDEEQTAKEVGFETYLLSFEKLMEGNAKSAIRFIPTQTKKELAFYRGWMMKPKMYALLYNELLEKNIMLINTPTEYEHCHYLPNSYYKIESITPFSKWIKLDKAVDFDEIYELLNDFGENQIILKDYVKSEKYYWKEACFITNPKDKDSVKKIVEKFVELRGNQLNEGLVLRKFEQLEFLTKHSKSSLPLTKELRLFFFHQSLVAYFNYWDEVEYGKIDIELDKFLQVAKTIESNFFTMDIAQKTDGEWIIIELGDGQVSGLPDNADKNSFYNNLKKLTLQR
ncbi:ATP-grasp domain-containing protein [Bernardetia sp.]|uniref:ATP-grasp domain-containing protein n=1 Tax=Bernardetia sp. TaxID=1937974 RepID=UPI0025C73522|nr:ATP-grasp domain-containing protein [Bernardetia sp.]